MNRRWRMRIVGLGAGVALAASVWSGSVVQAGVVKTAATETTSEVAGSVLSQACSTIYSTLPDVYTFCHQAITSLWLNANATPRYLREEVGITAIDCYYQGPRPDPMEDPWNPDAEPEPDTPLCAAAREASKL